MGFIQRHSKRQLFILVVMAFGNFFNAMCVSLQAPFFPDEAEKKGATATEYGLIFGIFELVGLIASPIYGSYMKIIQVKRLFIAGTFTAGIATIIFGFLDKINDRVLFIGSAFACRIFEGLGSYGFFISSFAVIATDFRDNLATTFAAMESFFGIGMIFGPVVGEGLYTLGGYFLPFVVLGSCYLIIGTLVPFILPKITSPPEEVEKKGMLKVLRIPGVFMSAIGISTTSLTLGFISATLEPHIRQFNLNNLIVGLIFVCNGGFYAFSSPFWGYLVDKKVNPKLLSFFGAIIIILAFIIVGPVNFLPLDPNVYYVVVGMILHGIGMGAIFVTSFSDALDTAVRHGFANNVGTYGLISGVWTSSFAFGAFLGPSVSGVLFDTFGFRASTNFILTVEIVVAALFLWFAYGHKENSRILMNDSSEMERLKSNDDDDESTLLVPIVNGYGSTSHGG